MCVSCSSNRYCDARACQCAQVGVFWDLGTAEGSILNSTAFYSTLLVSASLVSGESHFTKINFGGLASCSIVADQRRLSDRFMACMRYLVCSQAGSKSEARRIESPKMEIYKRHGAFNFREGGVVCCASSILRTVASTVQYFRDFAIVPASLPLLMIFSTQTTQTLTSSC